MKLEKEKILTEAFDLLNEVGLQKFNLRALASRLSVSATALYWHFKNKDMLYGTMVVHIFNTAFKEMNECQKHKEWQSILLILGRTLRTEIGKHRDSVLLITTNVPNYNSLESTRYTISHSVVRAGLDEKTALLFESIVIAFVVGWMSYHQNPTYNKYLSSMFSFNDGFECGLEALVNGFQQKLEQTSAKELEMGEES